MKSSCGVGCLEKLLAVLVNAAGASGGSPNGKGTKGWWNREMGLDGYEGKREGW